jgi:hypothetical protein
MYIVVKNGKVFAGLPDHKSHNPCVDGLMWNDWPPKYPSTVIIYPNYTSFENDVLMLREQGLYLEGELTSLIQQTLLREIEK